MWICGKSEAQTWGAEWPEKAWGKASLGPGAWAEKAQNPAGSFRPPQVRRGLMGRGTDFDPVPGTSSVQGGFEMAL